MPTILLLLFHVVLKIKSKISVQKLTFHSFSEKCGGAFRLTQSVFRFLLHIPFTLHSLHKSHNNAFLKLSCSQYPPSLPVRSADSIHLFHLSHLHLIQLPALWGRPNRQLWEGGPQSLMESQMDKNRILS